MEKVKIGIIGTGNRGIVFFGREFQKRNDTEVAAIADPNKERMKSALSIMGNNAEMYTDFREMLKKAKIDVVVITTPDFLHKEEIVASLKAGKNVLTDKPMATTTGGCIEIARVSRKTGKTVDMGFNLRHEIVCKKIKELIDTNIIGNVVQIKDDEYYEGGRTYFSRWNRYYSKGGGLFCHKGSHDFDLQNWFNGNGLPIKVSAFAGFNVFRKDRLPFKLEKGEKAGPYCEKCKVAYKCPDKVDITENEFGKNLFSGKSRNFDKYNRDTCMYLSDKDTHDNGVVIVEYDNGVRSTYSQCFFTPFTTRRFSVSGDRGHIDGDLKKNIVTVYPRWSKDKIEYHLTRPEGGHGGADPIMVDAFIKNFKTGNRPVATIRDGALSVAIAEAAEKSRRENRTVFIEELITKREMKIL